MSFGPGWRVWTNVEGGVREILELSSRDRPAYGVLGEAPQVGVCLGAEVDAGGDHDVEMEDPEDERGAPVGSGGGAVKERPRRPHEEEVNSEEGEAFGAAVEPDREEEPLLFRGTPEGAVPKSS